MDVVRFVRLVLRHVLTSRSLGEFLNDHAVVILSSTVLFWLVRGAVSRTAVAVWRVGALTWVLWTAHATAHATAAQATAHATGCAADSSTDACDPPPFGSAPPQWVTHACLCLACVAEACRLIAGIGIGAGVDASSHVSLLRSIDRTLRGVHDHLTHARSSEVKYNGRPQ